jgi:signal transduction histidine kinase
VLITYNVMLFAVVGLLVGATILRPAESSPERDRWLRRLIIGVAILTLIVSLYALSAIIFRTINDRLTPNRLAFIGWNIINIGLLALLLILQWRAKKGQWVAGLYQTFSVGTAVYAIWIIVLVLALPWLFGVDQENVASLPVSIQQIIYEEPSPVLLKCFQSPHIYLLEGAKSGGLPISRRLMSWVTCGEMSILCRVAI